MTPEGEAGALLRWKMNTPTLLPPLCQQGGSRLFFMRRTERLFAIIQVLRRSRRPVTGQQLAAELEVSLRTLYRDMAELLTQGVPIRGEAGTGYVIDAQYDMPPLMLTPDELEAAVLGAAWVAQRGDAALARGARDLIAKLTAAVPRELHPVILDAALHPLSFREKELDRVDIAALRGAIRTGHKVRLDYSDADGRSTSRIIWPILLVYMEDVRIVVGYCELRSGFRHFRTDRVLALQVLEATLPERSATLRQRWEEERKRERERKSQPREQNNAHADSAAATGGGATTSETARKRRGAR